VVSGTEGLELTGTHRYDLILVDAHLPDCHGSEFIAAVRLGSQNDTTPIVAASNDDSRDNIALLLEAGACEFVGKPIAAAKLAELVDRWAPANRRSSNPSGEM
jgi:DNA-binding response OmpR family regulator